MLAVPETLPSMPDAFSTSLGSTLTWLTSRLLQTPLHPKKLSLKTIPGQSSHELPGHPGCTSSLLCGSCSHLILII